MTVPCSIRPTTAGDPARSLASSASGAPDGTHTAREGSTWPGSEPPPTVASVSTTRASGPEASAIALARASRRSTLARDLPPHRDLARGDAGAVEREGRRHRGEQHLVRAHRAGQRVLAQPRDQVFATDHEAGLGTADQLVPAERHEVGTIGEAFRGHRLVREAEGGRVEERAAAEVVDDERAVRVGGRSQRARVGRLHEAGLAEVRGVHAEDEAGASVGQRRLEVGDARAVRRPDLDQLRPRASDDLGDPDAAPDLDELAAAHRDAALARQPHGERDGRGVVDQDQRVLGARERDQVLLGLAVAAPPAPRLAVELEEDRSLGRGTGRLDGGSRPRRAAQVRVDDDTRGIDDALGAGAALEGLEACDDVRGDRLRGSGRPLRRRARQARALLVDDGARHREDGGRVAIRGLCADVPPARVRRSGDVASPAGRSSRDHRRPRERGWRERMGVEPTARRRAPRHRF